MRHVENLLDGYRLSVAAAIAFGKRPRQGGKSRTTMFQTSSLDDDARSLRTVIIEIFPEASSWPYRAAEDLAEQGATILEQSIDGDEIWFGDLINRIEQANELAVKAHSQESATVGN